MSENEAQRSPSWDTGEKAIIRHIIFWPIFVVVLIVDLWSKSAVFGWLQSSGRSGFTIIEGFLRLQLTENSGAAFGIAAGQRFLLVAVSAAALVVVVAVVLFAGENRRIVQVALALFAAGVAGNLYDRIFNNGLVRDFIDVMYWPGRHWPAFNVADSSLCIAVGLLVLFGFATRQSFQKPAHQQK